MARSLNEVKLIGNLTADVEVRYMPNGNAAASFTVATSEQRKDQQGQPQERTEFSRCVVYKKLAEIAGEYLHKGSKVYVCGKLATREWTDQQGVKRYTTEIIISDLMMLDGKQQGMRQNAPQRPQQQNNQYQQPQNGGYMQNNEPPMDFIDDIPF